MAGTAWVDASKRFARDNADMLWRAASATSSAKERSTHILPLESTKRSIVWKINKGMNVQKAIGVQLRASAAVMIRSTNGSRRKHTDTSPGIVEISNVN